MAGGPPAGADGDDSAVLTSSAVPGWTAPADLVARRLRVGVAGGAAENRPPAAWAAPSPSAGVSSAGALLVGASMTAGMVCLAARFPVAWAPSWHWAPGRRLPRPPRHRLHRLA